MKVIGLLAPSGSGKTALAHKVAHLHAHHGTKCAVVSIATPIKQDLLHRFGIPAQHGPLIFPVRFGDQTATTYREAMQFYGDLLRKIDPDCFLRQMWHNINSSGADVVIIDDVRKQDEVDDIRLNDAEVFLIQRPSLLQSEVPANAHPTERFAESANQGNWINFVNDQPLDLSAQSLYAAIRNI